MADIKNISDVGQETINLYDATQQQLDPLFEDVIQRQSPSSLKVEIITTTSSYKSEIDELLGISKTTSWGNFSEPTNFSSSRSNVFTYQIIPSLGDSTSSIEKIKATSHSQDIKEDHSIKKLEKFLSTLKNLQTIADEISGKRNQYQKG